MSGHERLTLKRWSEEVSQLDRKAAWPGPRPFGERDPVELLVGRTDDSQRFRNIVHENQLVILDGESGVGKSSLLSKALVPELEHEDVGFTVAIVNDWSDDRQSDTVELLVSLVKEAMSRALDRQPTEVRRQALERCIEQLTPTSGGRFFGELNGLLGRRCVLIFDQFEELILHSGARASSVIDLILLINAQLDLRVVISLRSEFVHRLGRVQAGARPYSFSSYTLKPISSTAARKLITAPNELAGRQRVAIDARAAAAVARIWDDATLADDGTSTRPDAPGVLMLQALLFVLDSRARNQETGEPTTVDTSIVSGFLDKLAKAQQATDREWAESVLVSALSEAVDVKLGRCERIAHLLGVDRFLIEGARLYAARCAPQLSSASYKLLREADDLVNTVLGSELDTLRAGMGLPLRKFEFVKRDLLGAVLRPLVTRRQNDADTQECDDVDLIADDARRIAAVVSPRDRDREPDGSSDLLQTALEDEATDATCGPLMGMPAAVGLIEEHRRFGFALAWLKVSQLVRLTSPTPGQTIVALVHDRFGAGVNGWARSVGGRPRDTFAAITRPKGLDVFWQFDLHEEDRRSIYGDPGAPRVVPNLRWRGGWVSAPFENVIFVNCDLRGTMFDGSSFNGVAFVNCLLDGTMFSDCTFVGAVPHPIDGAERRKLSPDWAQRDGRFWVGLDDEHSYLAHSWAHYRGGGAEAPHTGVRLLSPGAGTSVLVTDDDGPDLRQLWTGEAGGVVVYGGRISTLVVRTPVFEEIETGAAGIALRYVAGSGLDLVELDQGVFIEVTGSALRHLTLSPSTMQSGAESPEIRIDVSTSALAQVWLSPGLQGEFALRDSRVVQVWNESRAVVAVAEEAMQYDVVEWADQPSIHSSDLRSLTALLHDDDDVKSFRASTRRMDYVRDPRPLG